eukprot:SAG31_NODE_396_length_16264_cov_17.206496_12_plen_167_part_00
MLYHNNAGRQLFVDPFLISHADGLETLYHTATYEPLNPVLASDRPWEVWQYGLQSGEGYCGVATPFSGGIWWDPTAAEYKLYYRCGQTVCLAISADALRWTKPALDVVNGTNIVVRGGDVGRVTVWLDLESRGDEVSISHTISYYLMLYHNISYYRSQTRAAGRCP